MTTVLEELKQRGFVEQCSDEEALGKDLSDSKVTFYAGFDPTAQSLHAGSLVPIMAMGHLQRAGHIPIAVVGGGTTMVGDPSGKTELRKLLSPEDITANGEKILVQLQRFLDLDEGKGHFVNNADWLMPLKYIDFLRDIGRYFKVNEMLRMESYRQRLEREDGLSFIEFNYQLLQAYDFLVLFDKYGCTLQVGGNDQWGNILAGSDLIKKFHQGQRAYALTFPLLQTSRGQKMGKTEAGAVWLDPAMTSPYEYYQYWINTDDQDVERFLKFFTFLPLDQIAEVVKVEGADIREAKKVLAFEATALNHGKDEAQKAADAAVAAFGGGNIASSDLPSTDIPASEIAEGMGLLNLLVRVGMASSNGDARRTVQDGGAYVNNERIQATDHVVTDKDVEDGMILLRKGKKKHHRINVT